jgi:hypothetical protein
MIKDFDIDVNPIDIVNQYQGERIAKKPRNTRLCIFINCDNEPILFDAANSGTCIAHLPSEAITA